LLLWPSSTLREMKRFEVISGILVALVLMSALFYGGIIRHNLRANGRYTIGLTVGQNGKFIRYRFSVNGVQQVNENQRLKYSPVINGGRYFVKYLPSDLTVSQIHFDKPVPHTIVEAPEDGWPSLPSN
jgi:hypothetical protein